MDVESTLRMIQNLVTPHYGLQGLDPLLVKDPRFDYGTRISPQTGGVQLLNKGDAINARFDRNMQFLPDLPYKTVADDMWSVTAGGKSGTSVGDRSSPFFTEASRNIVGGSKNITPDMVHQLLTRILEMREPEVRQTHPGKAAYSPEGEHY